MSQERIFGIANSVVINMCADAADATERGYFYREPEYHPLDIQEVVVVKDGTVSGKPTVDLILVDKNGQKYVTMLTGALVASIPCKGD